MNETRRTLRATFNTYEGALGPTLSLPSHDAPRAWLTAVSPPSFPARTFLNSSCRPLSPRASGGLTTTAGGVRGCSSSHSAVTPSFCADPPCLPHRSGSYVNDTLKRVEVQLSQS